jgi:hypothetical protein
MAGCASSDCCNAGISANDGSECYFCKEDFCLAHFATISYYRDSVNVCCDCAPAVLCLLAQQISSLSFVEKLKDAKSYS